MKLKLLALGMFSILGISACKKEQPAKPGNSVDVTQLEQTNTCNGLELVWSFSRFYNTANSHITLCAITTDVFDDILISGVYSGVVDLNPGEGVFNTTEKGVFVSKFSAGGKFKGAWTIQVPDMHQDVKNVNNYEYTLINTDKQGNVYLTIQGVLTSTNQIQIIKADRNGRIKYHTKFINGTTDVKSVVDSKGCVISLIGTGEHVLLHKIDQNGKIMGAKIYNEIDAFHPLKLAIDNDDNLYALAEFYSPGPFYNIYFQTDKLGNLTRQDRNTANFTVDRKGFVYKIGDRAGKYTRDGVTVDDFLTDGLMEFSCDTEGNFYRLYQSKNESTKQLSGPGYTATLPLPGRSVMLVPDNKGGVIISHTTQSGGSAKFTISKYRPCK